MRYLFLLLFITSHAIASRTIDADIIKSSSHALTWTLPATTGTMMCQDSVDTLTNKTFDAEGTGNSLSNVNSTAIKNGTIVNADINASAAIAYSKLTLTGAVTSSDITDGTITNADIAVGANIAMAKLVALSSGKATITDGSGNFTGSTTTSTQIGYLNTLSSNVQTQMDLKAPLASPTFTGTVTVPATITAPSAVVLTFPTVTGTLATLAGSENLSSKTLVTPTLSGVMSGGTVSGTTIVVNDDVFTVQDNTTPTKKLQLQLSGITGGTTRTLTVPDANDTIVGKATTDVLTNKSIDADGTGNVITNIENADIKAAAAIALNKLAATTASKLLVSDGSGFVSATTVTATEAGYLSGVTSAVQTQLNSITTIATGRNKIQNGDMRIDQRNEAASVALSSAAMSLDRWGEFKNNTSATGTVQQVTSSVPTGFSHALKVTLTGIDSALGATDQIGISQTIEGSATADLTYGAAAALNTTLSFWVRSSLTGTYCVAYANSGNSRAYIAEYSISQADTWEQKTITIAGDTTGTWLNTEGTVGLYLYWMLMNGSTYQRAGGAWAADSTKFSTSNQVNWAANASATFWITGVQLEKGSTATSYEWDDINIAYTKAQRFYLKTYNRGVAVATNTDTGARNVEDITTVGTTVYMGATHFNVPMYSAPTMAIYSDVGTASKMTRADTRADVGTGATATTIGLNGFYYVAITTGIAATTHTFHFTADTGK